MIRHLQKLVQFIFLLLFFLLLLLNKVQIWMVVFLTGLIASYFFGRFYCGWLCPINTLMRWISILKNKLHIKSIRIPQIMTKPQVRILILILFLATFIFTILTHKKLPVLPAILILALVITMIFPEQLWHRYLCPYGTILRIPASKSRYRISINKDLCNGCGICQRVCPASTITHESKGSSPVIYIEECLLCMDCVDRCRQNAMQFEKNQ